MKDFFISYTSADRSWADWIAQELRGAGYTTVHQAWDFRPGANFVSEMKKALQDSKRTIAVCSPNYFNSGFGEDEWTAAFADRSLLPVRVRECEIPKLLRTRVYIDLVSMDAGAARDALLRGVNPDAVRPRAPVEFPGDRRRYPGALPDVWEVPQGRNPNFTGRDQMLADLHDGLQSRGAAAIAGLGGVGKTHLALEYAYRYASEYNLVWWLRAEDPSTLASDFARMAGALKLPDKDVASQPDIIAAVRRWLEHNSGWLLVFDNAPGPEACDGCRPRSNAGHVLITSRNPVWRGAAEPLPVRQLSREESVAFLKKRAGRDEPDAANALSDAVGDLPLALEHAGAYIESTAVSIAEYLALYREYSKELLEPVQATWRISFDKLRTENPDALDLLNVAAWLAPDNIPRELLQSTRNPLAFNKSIEALRRYSLIQVADGAIGVHRLVQKVTREWLDESGQRRWAEAALKLVNDAFPSEALDYRNWPACARLLSHAAEVTSYAEALSVALEECGRLLNQAGLYEQTRAQLRGAEQFLRRALEIGERVSGPDHPDVAIRANNIGQILQAQGDLAGALQYTRRALEIDEKAYGPDHPSVARDANNIGLILKAQGDLAGALQYARRAPKTNATVYSPGHPKVAIHANNIGQILKAQGDLAGALQYTRRALQIDEKVYGPDHPNVARDTNNIGQILKAQGDLDGALQYARRAQEIDEKVSGPDHPNVAICANNIGQILQDQGDLDPALQYTRRALEIDEKVYGPDHPNVAIRANNIGQILKAQGDLDGALQYARRALEIDEKVSGPDHPNVAICANNIGQILQAQGDLDAALQYTRRALEIDEKIYGPAHPNVAIRANNIGQILKAQGDLAGALQYTRRALEIDEKVYGPGHPKVAIRANNIGQILQAQGDLAGALQYASRALEIDEKIYGPDHPEIATDANNIGLILQAQGDLAGALQYTRRALRILESTYGPENPSTEAVAANLRELERRSAAGA